MVAGPVARVVAPAQLSDESLPAVAELPRELCPATNNQRSVLQFIH